MITYSLFYGNRSIGRKARSVTSRAVSVTTQFVDANMCLINWQSSLELFDARGGRSESTWSFETPILAASVTDVDDFIVIETSGDVSRLHEGLRKPCGNVYNDLSLPDDTHIGTQSLTLTRKGTILLASELGIIEYDCRDTHGRLIRLPSNRRPYIVAATDAKLMAINDHSEIVSASWPAR
jgi:hypothetical protein